MLEYDPRKRSYPGDDQLRVCTQQHKKRRASSKSSSADKYVDDGLSVSNVKKARVSDRICETLDDLNVHMKSFKSGTNAKACVRYVVKTRYGNVLSAIKLFVGLPAGTGTKAAW